MHRLLAPATLLSAATVLLTSAAAHAAEPWVDPDPAEPNERLEVTDTFGITADAEYRAQLTYVEPIALNSEANRHFNTLEHRARVGGTFDYDEQIKLRISLDFLDGVLWGDTGSFGGDPSSDSGLQAPTRDPNLAKPCIGLIGDDPLEAESYGYTLCAAEAVKVRRLWVQVNTPIGALRVGRQPVSVGMGIQTTPADGRKNRFGVDYEGDQVDRLLFATKPLEAFKPKSMRSTSEQEGLITVVMYDRWVSDSVKMYADDIHQLGGALRFLEPDFVVGKDLVAQLHYVHRWDKQYKTRINTVGGNAMARFGGLHFGFDMAANIGSTREVSIAYQVISNDPPVDQEILQYGARGVVRYDWRPDGSEERPPMLTGYVEVDYASGDPDPDTRTTLSQFRFSEDTNVGLLLFDHIVRFQSARAAAAGTEIVRRLGAVTFPPERVDTRGSFTSAFALFPQADFRPHDTVLLRGGVLFAWAPHGVIDPVASLQGRDGVTIEDDLVNFVGGKPGDYYGTEIDGRFQWKFLDHFAIDLEAAVLFPGDALKDANGHAVNSFLGQGRTTVYF